MPVPKRKTSKSRRDKRHANKHLKVRIFTLCFNCQTPIMPHQTCMVFGFYKGRKVLATKLDRVVRRHEVQQQAAHRQAQQPSAEEQSHNE